MARLLGPDMGSRYCYLASGAPAASVPAVAYADTAGTLADIRAYDGSETPGGVILGSSVTTDADGLLPLFWFPDDIDRLYVRVNGGALTPIDADNNRRLDQLVPVANVRTYGAVGDGVADDRAAIQAAVDSGGVVQFPAGTFRINAPIDVSASNVHIQGAGPGLTTILVNFAGTADSDTSAFRFRGTLPAYASPTTTLTADAGPNLDNWDSRALTVASSAGIAGGDVLLVGDSFADTWSDSGWANRRRGELVRVESVAGTTITLRAPLRDTYLVANTAAVWRPTMLTGVGVSDLTIRNNTPGSSWVHGVTFDACRNVTVRNVATQDLDACGVNLKTVYGATVTGITCRDHTDDGANNRYGYGVMFGACDQVVVSASRFMRVRHAVTTAGNTGHVGYARNIVVSDCTSVQCSSSGFDTHPWATDVTIANCRAEHNQGSGIMVRSGRTAVTGCVTRANKQPGVSVQYRQAVDVLVAGNTLYDEVAHGISFGGSAADGYPSGVDVRDNTIVRARGWGVYINVAVVKLRVLRNLFVDANLNAGTPGARQAVHIDTTVPLDGAWLVWNTANAVNNVTNLAAAQVNIVASGNRLVGGVGTSPAAVKGTPGAGALLIDNAQASKPALTYSRTGEPASAAALRAALVALDLVTDSTTA